MRHMKINASLDYEVILANRESCLQAINDIQTGSSTNLTGGWSLGRDDLKKAPADAVRRIVAASLEAHGIRTSCLGFGDHYNEDIMTALAQATSGQFYDADSPDKFPAIFESELDGLQKIAIQNLRLCLRRLDFYDSIQPLAAYPAVSSPDDWTEYFIGENRPKRVPVDAIASPR